MRATMRNERGSAVILAVMAMLIMGVLSISFALLADIESRVGINYKQQAQAEALAEGALERARDAIRDAPTAAGGFTRWLDGTVANHILFSSVALGAGSFSARIDNDCAPEVVPAAIKEPVHQPGNAACNNTTDYNEVAVVTAWATSGSGRSRVRAIVGVDNPWKHVCSSGKPDNNGYCNEPGNRNGNPTVNPADPNDPNGPQAYNDLPRPILGCSRVAPGLHRGTVPLAAQHGGCQANPLMYPYPYPTAYNAPPRMVIMGELPAAGGKTCNNEPAGGNGNVYFGYFDCALTTLCDPGAGHACGGGPLRKGCLRGPLHAAVFGGLPDTRVASDPTHYTEYDPASGTCVGGDTGMVFTGAPQQNFAQNIGSQTRQVTVYVHDGTANFTGNRQFYGTFVVEGNEVNSPCSDKDWMTGGGAASELWAGPNADPAPAGWTFTNQYGFPIVALIYNPDLPPPTITPTYAPQGTCADMGSNNSQIHGMVYSGGHVEVNPLQLDGTVVAFEIQTQGSATYNYNTWYGNNSPPPGFPFGAGNQVVVIRKSFMVCSNYSDDAGAPTNCN